MGIRGFSRGPHLVNIIMPLTLKNEMNELTAPPHMDLKSLTSSFAILLNVKLFKKIDATIQNWKL